MHKHTHTHTPCLSEYFVACLQYRSVAYDDFVVVKDEFNYLSDIQGDLRHPVSGLRVV